MCLYTQPSNYVSVYTALQLCVCIRSPPTMCLYTQPSNYVSVYAALHTVVSQMLHNNLTIPF